MSEQSLVHIVLVALLDVKNRILLCRKKGDVWMLLGGHVEFADLSRGNVIAREILEESRLEGIFGRRLLFQSDEQKDDHLYMFDVFVGYYYEEKSPVPLVREGILEEQWFSFEHACALNLTPIARRTIDLLGKVNRSFLSECRHHLQVVINLAQSQGEDMTDLKMGLSECEKALNRISRVQTYQKIDKQITILIVDDSKEVLETFKETFEYQGYQVYAFLKPEEAGSWLRTSTVEIDVLIVDYQMPEMTGTELIKDIRKFLDPKTRVILISGADISKEEKGGVQFFRKPVLINELIRVIK